MIATKKIVTELQDGFWVFYWLIETKLPEGNAYGILLEKQKGLTIIEREEVTSFSYQSNKVISLIQQLAKQKVTPITLIDVIEDYISSEEIRMALDDIMVS